MSPQDASGVVLRAAALRRHPLRHRLAPGRSVPLFTGSTRAEVVASQVGNVNNPQYPGFEDFGDMMVRGDGGTGLHPRRLVHARRARHLGRRPPDDPRHRRLHRDPQEHRHRRPAGRQPPVPRRQEGDALHRLREGRAAVRRAAGGRRREPHRDGDAAGALLPGDRAGAQGAEAGAARHVQGRDAADERDSSFRLRRTGRRRADS